MKFTIAVIFVLCSIPLALCAVKCLSPDGEEVDWWTTLKKPGVGNFFYYDSNMAKAKSDGEFRNMGSASLESLFAQHSNKVNELNKHEGEYLTNMAKSIKLSEAKIKNFKVIQYAYNDQPPQTKYDGMFYGPKKIPGQKDTQNLKLAHSKGVLTLELGSPKTTFIGGYLIAHSFPGSPAAIFSNTLGFVNSFFPPKEQKNVLTKSQHGVCISFGSDRANDIVKLVGFIWPNVYQGNINLPLLEKIMKNSAAFQALSDAISGDTGFSKATACIEKWKNHRSKDIGDALELDPKTDYQDCITESIIDGVHIIGHAPGIHFGGLPDDTEKKGAGDPLEDCGKTQVKLLIGSAENTAEIQARKKEKQEKLTLKPVTYLGPVHWYTTAKILQTSLYVQCWKNGDIPSINGEYNLYLVESVCYPPETNNAKRQEGWFHGSMHEKIGIAASESVDKKPPGNKHWVCFADGNHRASETSHAGLKICFNEEKLWKLYRKGISIINTYSPITTSKQSDSFDKMIPTPNDERATYANVYIDKDRQSQIKSATPKRKRESDKPKVETEEAKIESSSEEEKPAKKKQKINVTDDRSTINPSINNQLKPLAVASENKASLFRRAVGSVFSLFKRK